MSDPDLGHASSLAEQLRLAEENGNLPDELAEEWEIEQGDQIPFYAEEGSDTAEIRRPAKDNG